MVPRTIAGTPNISIVIQIGLSMSMHPVCPLSSCSVPDGHADCSVAPVAETKLSGSAGRQPALPSVDWYVPGRHGFGSSTFNPYQSQITASQIPFASSRL